MGVAGAPLGSLPPGIVEADHWMPARTPACRTWCWSTTASWVSPPQKNPPPPPKAPPPKTKRTTQKTPPRPPAGVRLRSVRRRSFCAPLARTISKADALPPVPPTLAVLVVRGALGGFRQDLFEFLGTPFCLPSGTCTRRSFGLHRGPRGLAVPSARERPSSVGRYGHAAAEILDLECAHVRVVAFRSGQNTCV